MDAISIDKIAETILIVRELPRAENELRGLIEALNEDERAELVALMWIGRGSFEAEELAEATATAREEATTDTADYLIGTPNIADHLETAMEMLGLDIAEAERGLM